VVNHQRVTAQGNEYQTKTNVVIHQIARATPPTTVDADSRSSIYDIYDKAMSDLMGEIFRQTQVSADGNTIDYKTLRRTFATPDRAFAAMARQLGVPVKGVPLPFGSLMSGDPIPDPRRDNRTVISKGLSYDGKDVLMHEWPAPFNIPYTFQIWCRTDNERKVFWEQCVLAGWYADELFITVDLPRRLGEVSVSVEWAGTNFGDNLEPGADQQRDLRVMFNFTVRGWIPRRAINRRSVLQVKLDKCAVKTTADLDNVQPNDIVEQYGTDIIQEA